MRGFLDFVESNSSIFSVENFENRLRRKNRFNPRIVEERNKVTPEMINHHRKEINSLPASHIRKWRSTILAHLEKAAIQNDIDVVRQYPIKQEHIEITIDSIDNILNYYCAAFDASIWSKGIPIKDGIDRILNAIQKERLERKRDYDTKK
jgi:hypothetical protein